MPSPIQGKYGAVYKATGSTPVTNAVIRLATQYAKVSKTSSWLKTYVLAELEDGGALPIDAYSNQSSTLAWYSYDGSSGACDGDKGVEITDDTTNFADDEYYGFELDLSGSPLDFSLYGSFCFWMHCLAAVDPTQTVYVSIVDSSGRALFFKDTMNAPGASTGETECNVKFDAPLKTNPITGGAITNSTIELFDWENIDYVRVFVIIEGEQACATYPIITDRWALVTHSFSRDGLRIEDGSAAEINDSDYEVYADGYIEFASAMPVGTGNSNKRQADFTAHTVLTPCIGFYNWSLSHVSDSIDYNLFHSDWEMTLADIKKWTAEAGQYYLASAASQPFDPGTEYVIKLINKANAYPGTGNSLKDSNWSYQGYIGWGLAMSDSVTAASGSLVESSISFKGDGALRYINIDAS